MCPEAPEIKLSKDAIYPILKNQKITDITIYPSSRYANINPEGLIDFKNTINNIVTLTDISVKGKFMFWSFSNNWYMFNTHGMSGQWNMAKGKHPCISFTYGNNESMYFNDPRHFGTIKFTNNKKDLLEKLNHLGWDPFQIPWEGKIDWIKSKLNNNKTISELLMNQSIFAGVGNYIKAESLYLAKLSPWRLGSSLSDDEIKLLCESIGYVMNTSYDLQGASILTYKGVDGKVGKATSFFKVYRKKKDSFNNNIITETTPDKRTTHWCPTIQK